MNYWTKLLQKLLFWTVLNLFWKWTATLIYSNVPKINSFIKKILGIYFWPKNTHNFSPSVFWANVLKYYLSIPLASLKYIKIYFNSKTDSTKCIACTIASKINGTPKGVYLFIPKLHSILAVANLLAPNNIIQFCSCGQISLQSAAVNCSFSDNLDTFGGNIYFADDGA